MARQIAKAKAVRLEFTPLNAPLALVTFDVSGFDQHVGRVAAACGWSPDQTRAAMATSDCSEWQGNGSHPGCGSPVFHN
jgi:hypothetical protein